MYKRGDILVADLGRTGGSEQAGERFVVVISNNVGNKFSPTLIVVSMTSQIKNMHLPTHIRIKPDKYKFLSKDTMILAEQIRTLDKLKVKTVVSSLSESDLNKLNRALKVSIAV